MLPDKDQTNDPEDEGVFVAAFLRELLEEPHRDREAVLEQYLARYPDRAGALRRAHEDLVAAPDDDLTGDLVADSAGKPERVLGHYRLFRLLGSGGQGAVYLAEDTRLRRKVAVKILSAFDAASTEALARFQREAEIASHLDHPAICPVFDTGFDRGLPFYVMRHVEGRTLAEEIHASHPGRGAVASSTRTPSTGPASGATSRPASLASILRLARIVERAALAVHVAHEAGVLHRDLKPQNIMVTAEDAPVILDFGLARMVEQEPSLRSRCGDVFGTPVYMPPELFETPPAPAERRADVYALGATLYECLTGRRPFEAATREGLYQTILRGDPLDPRAHNEAIPRDLSLVALTAMEKDRDRRYHTALAFAEDLRRVREHEPIHARPTRAWTMLMRWAQRNPAVACLLLAVLVTLTGGLSVSLVQKARADANAAIAETNAIEAKRQEGIANGRAAQMAKLAQEKGELAEAHGRAKDAAQANLDRYNLLSDLVRLREVRAAERTLYPAFPTMAEKMQRWLEVEARPLEQRLPIVRAARDEVRARALASLPAASRPASVTASQAAELLPPGNPDRFLLERLNELVADLESFTAEKGELRSVEARLREAGTIWQRSIGDHRAKWDQAITAIAKSDDIVASKLYDGLKITAQIGLVPIGMDRESKLWEFAHLPSGEIAKVRERDHKMFIKDETGIVFVLLPGGEFWMGAQRDDPKGENYDPQAERVESPVHQVKLSAFFLSKHEMTQGQWLRLSSGENPSYNSVGRRSQGDPVPVGYTHPVEQVDWTMCDTLTMRQGLCLPTEAQWEYGCRGGTRTSWWPGDAASDLAGCGNLLDQKAQREYREWGRQEGDFDDGYAGSAPVGRYRANAFGLHDMHGNLWEWCRDWALPYSMPRDPRDGLRLGDPSGAHGFRAYRGGCFNFPAHLARSANRNGSTPSIRGFELGLRPARVITE